jgi:hypothetical protein
MHKVYLWEERPEGVRREEKPKANKIEKKLRTQQTKYV